MVDCPLQVSASASERKVNEPHLSSENKNFLHSCTFLGDTCAEDQNRR